MGNIELNFCLNRKDFKLDVDLKLPASGVSAIYGPSGCGKTTLLRCIAGLEDSAQGALKVKSSVWQDGASFLPTYKRPLGLVFQESSLLPHLSAQGNLDYALKRCSSKPNVTEVDTILEVMGVQHLLHKKPAQLSGGERQRIAIARALLTKPQLLLMDEPLASLDSARKAEILPYLEKIKADYSLPIIYVTHSIDEVARLADYLVLMEKGAVHRHGQAVSLLSELGLPFQAGDQAGVVIEGALESKDPDWGLDRISIGQGAISVPNSEFASGQKVRIRILAKDVSIALSEHKDSSILNKLPVIITDIAIDGSKSESSAMRLIKLQTGNHAIIARTTAKSVKQLALKVGDHVWAQIKSAAIVR